ncbi:hypothetical protein, partial [uncultured Microscilla sp.]|uniref:hypothetical protein n=1 Tax=uncultured Microscilla sp. TaxID=432653 RepID=UPI00262F70CB
QMKIGIEAWWNENKGWVIPTVIGVILGVTALIVVTGGAAIMPILSALMQGLTVIFGAMLVAQIAAPLKDYIVKAWKGDKKGASQSLAQAFAVGLTEIIFNLIFKGLGKLFKLIGKGAKAAMRGMKKLAQSTVRLTKRLGTALLRNGKVVFQGLKKGALKGSKSVGGMAQKLARRFRFKKITIKKTKQRIDVYGEFNPKVLVLTIFFGKVTDHKFRDLGVRLRKEFALSSKGGRPKEIGALNKGGNKIIVTDDFAEEFAKLISKEQKEYIKRLRKANTQAEREGIIKELGGNKEPAWFSDPTIPESVKNVARKRGDLRKKLKTPDGDEGHHAFTISNLGESKTLQDAVESGFGYNTGKNGVNLSKFSKTLDLDGVHASHPHYSEQTLALAKKFEDNFSKLKGYNQLHAQFFADAMAQKLINTIKKVCVAKNIKVDDLFKTGKGMGNIDPKKLYAQVIKDLKKNGMLPPKK